MFRGNKTAKNVNISAGRARLLRNGIQKSMSAGGGMLRQTTAKRYWKATENTATLARSHAPRRATVSYGRLKATNTASARVTKNTPLSTSRTTPSWLLHRLPEPGPKMITARSRRLLRSRSNVIGCPTSMLAFIAMWSSRVRILCPLTATT